MKPPWWVCLSLSFLFSCFGSYCEKFFQVVNPLKLIFWFWIEGGMLFSIYLSQSIFVLISLLFLLENWYNSYGFLHKFYDFFQISLHFLGVSLLQHLWILSRSSQPIKVHIKWYQELEDQPILEGCLSHSKYVFFKNGYEIHFYLDVIIVFVLLLLVCKSYCWCLELISYFVSLVFSINQAIISIYCKIG